MTEQRQRSATDQTTVYVRFSEQFLSVTGVTATTVKDRAVISATYAIHLAAKVARM